jgi:F-type H+-transporting ATPase subunit b
MNLRRVVLLLMFALAMLSVSFARQAKPPEPAHVEAAPANDSNAGREAKTASVSEQLAHASNEAAGKHGEEQEEGAEFKQSASVKFVANHTGLSPQGAYWLLVIVNFAIIAGLVGWALKKNLPGMFKTRRETIRKSMDEARRASEDANRRLSDIEGRLSRLDAEIAEMRKTAEADAVAEEQRIRAAAEEERRKIVEGSEQEIEAAAKAARRELKAYAANLAVSLAEKRIQVDAKTDEGLVQTFVHQLGKDGR